MDPRTVLHDIWNLYKSKHSEEYLRDFVEKLLQIYANVYDRDFIQFALGTQREGPHLSELPENLLPVLTSCLFKYHEQFKSEITSALVQDVGAIVRCLTVICRNFDNIPFVASCDSVCDIITIATLVIVSKDLQIDRNEAVAFLHEVFYFLECLYDPYFIWRSKCKGKTISHQSTQYQPALLCNEVLHFFYESFRGHNFLWPPDISIHCLHMFGGIIMGAEHNAHKAICPVTVEVLFQILTLSQHTVEVKRLVLDCILETVNVLRLSSPKQQQMELNLVLAEYQRTLSAVASQQNFSLLLLMLDKIIDMLQLTDRHVIQMNMAAGNWFKHFIKLVDEVTIDEDNGQKLVITVLKIFTAIIAGNPQTKTHFQKNLSVKELSVITSKFDKIEQSLLLSLLALACEHESDEDISSGTVHNINVIELLISILPNLENDQQIWLAQMTMKLCTENLHSRMQCCTAGLIEKIISVFEDPVNKLAPQTAVLLFRLLQCLGHHSVSPKELRKLFLMLRPKEDGKQFPYTTQAIHSLSWMARKEAYDVASYYLDIQEPKDGIAISGIRKWPGSGFSFHVWVRLDVNPVSPTKTPLYRRQLYSFYTSSAMGFEAFFLPDGVLVAAVCIRKEYLALTVSETPLDDGLWHSIAICHLSSRRPFAQSQVSVYIDGRQRATAQLKCPSLSEPFTYCCIGSAGQKTNVRAAEFSAPQSASDKILSTLPIFFSLPHALRASAPLDPGVKAIITGMQDSLWGPQHCLKGQLSNAIVFFEALQASQVKALHSPGPNFLFAFRPEDSSEIAELGSKILIYYHMKACKDSTAVDLSSNPMYEGHITGKRFVSYDIRDILNCIGGIQVFLPLLMYAQKTEEIPSLPGSSPTEPNPRSQQSEEDDDWVVLPNHNCSDKKLEQNQVAGFLLLLRNFITGHQVNQEQMLKMRIIPIVGSLMQKVPSSLLDVHVLMAVQLLVECIVSSSKQTSLLHSVYQHILFDFRIWSKSDFPVRIGHIQYLSTIIKDNRKYFRKKCGVQYMLDIIRHFYTVSQELSSDDMKTIRGSLLGLVKYYISKEINTSEMAAILGFLYTVKDENMVTELLEMLLGLMDSQNCRDQMFLLIFEPGCAELLYALLLNDTFSVQLKQKVLKLIAVLLKTDKVYEKSKNRLRLYDVGFPGFTSFLQGHPVSTDMVMMLLDQILQLSLGISYSSSSYQALLALLHFIRDFDLEVKLQVATKMLVLVKQKANAAQMIAKQQSWQDSIVYLLVKRPISPSQPHSLDTNPACSLDLAGGDGSASSFPAPENSEENFELDDVFPQPQHQDTIDSTMTDISSETDVPVSTPLLVGDDSPTPSPRPLKTPQYLLSHVFDFETQSLNNSQEDLSISNASDNISISSKPSITLQSVEIPGSGIIAELCNTLQTAELPGSGIIAELSSVLEERGEVFPFKQSILELSRADDEVAVEATELDEDKEVVLLQRVASILAIIFWKGVEGSDKQAWKERGRLFTCINLLALNNELYSSHLELKRLVLEQALQYALKDLNEAGQPHPGHTENAIELMKWIYDFVVIDANKDHNKKLSVELLESIVNLLDTLLIFEESPGEEEWTEMSHMGLGLLLACAACDNLKLCAVATPKLHVLVQTRSLTSLEEACYILGSVDALLAKDLEKGNQEHYSFLIPMMRALLERAGPRLINPKHLPGFPANHTGPTFLEDFQQYSKSEEWCNFISKQVKPMMEKYKQVTLKALPEAMNEFWNICYEATMVGIHTRNREWGECRLKFQSQILNTYNARCVEEIARYENAITQQKSQSLLARRWWRLLRVGLMGPRGAWKDRNPKEEHWKLAHHENFSRMRLKLVHNLAFDPHLDASQQRDNFGVTRRQSQLNSLSSIPLAADTRMKELLEDSLAEEDLMPAIPQEIESPGEQPSKEKLVMSESCEYVMFMTVVKGRLEITTSHVYFLDSTPIGEDTERQDFKWPLSQLQQMHLRRYNLRRTALEFFLTDQTNYFLNFSTKTRNKVYRCILSLHPPNLMYHSDRTPAELLRTSGITQKWVNREMSNFDYLMMLNTISGRSFNDLSQYPVFPWVLSDYTSEELDLNNPAFFRDLSRPIGVVNTKKIPAVKSKYEESEDMTGRFEKFHYGTHYSNSAGVLHYLVRLEPFTTFHIELQSGKFDVADRQFHSLPGTWHLLMESTTDVKELIPEFFYLPEFLINMNKFDLGRLQMSKKMVDDVILPPWAVSPYDFIYKHRKALESENVSAHLHEWIDLIFGHKQKGPAAVEALNIFSYCSYEGAVDLDAIKNEVEREQLEKMINNFGQIPCQLLKEPHPRRLTAEEALLKQFKDITHPPSILLVPQQLKAFYVEISAENDPVIFMTIPRSQTRSFIQQSLVDNMITISQSGFLGVHGWLPYDKFIPNYFYFEKDPTLSNAKIRRKISGSLHPAISINANLFVVTHDGRLLLSGGHWDNSLGVYSLPRSKTLMHVTAHLDIITCLSLDHFSSRLITGSQDTTCMIWEIVQQGGISQSVCSKPIQTLYGHEKTVTCVAIMSELDMAVSGSEDGTINVHTIRDGFFMRTLRPPCQNPSSMQVKRLALSDQGHIVAVSVESITADEQRSSLHVYSVNGHYLSMETFNSVISTILVTGDHVITGNSKGQVVIRELHELKMVSSLPLHVPIIHLATATNTTHILAALQDGKLIVIGITRQSEEKK